MKHSQEEEKKIFYFSSPLSYHFYSVTSVFSVFSVAIFLLLPFEEGAHGGNLLGRDAVGGLPVIQQIGQGEHGVQFDAA